MSPLARAPRLGLALLLLVTAPLALSSCSLKRMAATSVANTLAGGADVYGRDDDPELVRDALPFGLKTMESLLEILPNHEGLLLTACQGYTQYAYAFVQSEGDLVVNTDYERASALHERALKLYLRARGFGLRGLERRYRGISEQLRLEPEMAAARIRARDLPMLYWTTASWGAAIALGKDRPELLADLPAIRALVRRGLVLDEGYEGGAIHEALVVLDALPEAMGGSVERARRHYERAVELSRGERASPFVTMAQSVSVMNQDRQEFRALLHRALEIDPDLHPETRLVTIVLQRKARALLEREDEFFFEADTTQTQESP
jgi:hypothetical protein